jgi:hypothetical protein
MVPLGGCGVEVLAQIECGLEFNMASHFLAKESELKALQVDHQHIGRFLNEQGAPRWYQLIIKWTSVLVLSI